MRNFSADFMGHIAEHLAVVEADRICWSDWGTRDHRADVCRVESCSAMALGDVVDTNGAGAERRLVALIVWLPGRYMPLTTGPVDDGAPFMAEWPA